MNVNNEIEKIKSIEIMLAKAEVDIKQLTPCREASLAFTKIQEASFWLRYRQNDLKL